MDFHPTNTASPANAILVCRNARFNLLILVAVFWGIPGLLWYTGNPWIAIASAALALLLSRLVLGTWAKRGRAENWVLAVVEDGLWVNLRDCEYPEVEPGDTVVFLPYSELQTARHSTHRHTTRDGDGDVSRKDAYLDLQIASSDFDQLREELQAERQRRSPLKKFFGIIESGPGKIRQQPAQAIGDDLLRIKFTAGNYGLQPRPQKVLSVLSQYVSVDEPAQISTTETSQQTETEFAKHVSKMVTEGRDIEAIRLVQERMGKSLTEAKVFVDELRKKLP